MDSITRLAKHRSRLTVAALVLASFSGLTYPQTDNARKSRIEVKEETKTAQKAHQLTPAGEGSTPVAKAPSVRMTKTRSERKAETTQARSAGELMPAGEAGNLKQERATTSSKSTRTRAERKAETLQAAKEHKLTPAGEGATGPSK